MNYLIQLFSFFLCILMVAGCSSNQVVRFAAIGDTPYFESDTELAVVSEALTKMEAAEIPFVIHIGDIMRDRTSCERILYEQRAGIFSKSPIPFMITIGDNEFNDCKDSVTSRSYFREIILNNPSTQQSVSGTNEDFESLMVTRQQEMIENANWTYTNIDFIMLVLPDLPGRYPLNEEEIKRILSANTLFLVNKFSEAKKNNRDSIVLVMHSNPATCGLDACFDFMDVIEREIKKFKNPVLLINGSNHSKEFISKGYLGFPNLAHLRPGSEPDVAWPEVIFSTKTNEFIIKWHIEESDY